LENRKPEILDCSDYGKRISGKTFLPIQRCYLSVGHPSRVDELRSGSVTECGQKLKLTVKSSHPFVSPVTGTIKSMLPQVGYFGELSTSIAIEVMEDVWDEEFRMSAKTPSMEAVQDFLGSLPGQLELGSLLGHQPPLKTFVINGMDQDLLVTTNQIALKSGVEYFKRGAEILKSITGAERMILLVCSELASQAQNNGLEVRVMDSAYPSMPARLVMKSVFGKEVPAGSGVKQWEQGSSTQKPLSLLARRLLRPRCRSRSCSRSSEKAAPSSMRARIGRL
jgi:hypothetical protein